MKRLLFALALVGTSSSAFAQQPTFSKDIAPILQKSCQTCHRPGAIAPMSLLTYEDVRPWARSIKTKVASREMPPWYIDRNVGIHKFKDDPSLTAEEIATIAAWVDAGAPQGNARDLPPARAFSDNSTIRCSIAAKLIWSASRTTGTISPFSVLTARPMSQ